MRPSRPGTGSSAPAEGSAGSAQAPPPPAGTRLWLIGAALAVATFLAFLPVLGNGFVDYDDNFAVTQNRIVLRGLTPAGVAWAFTSSEQANWFPLARLSHLLDVQLFGLNATGHHLTSLLAHAVNAVLLLLVLRAATGAVWRSALVAGLFALHPLRVESVAWVAERKDVLAVLFWVLATGAYLRYARRPGWLRYLALVVALGLGLMAKPLLVTLPATLLLLDFWPLGRWRPGRGAASGAVSPLFLLLEKVPLFALSAASAAVTLWAQQKAGAVSVAHVSTWTVQLGNALFSWLKYLDKTFLPRDLSPLYAFMMHRPPPARMAAATIVLAVLTAVCCWAWRRRPEALVGWLWYLGTIVPMIGIVQVGVQAMADRYTYIPQIGLFVVVVWAAASPARRSSRWRPLAAAAAVAALVSLGALTNLQARHWKDTETLFRQALRVDPTNVTALVNVGLALTKRGELEAANEQFLAALRIFPQLPQVNLFLGANLRRLGRNDEALRRFQNELALFPRSAEAHGASGDLLRELGRSAEAERHFREALRIDPLHAESHRGLGLISLGRGDFRQAAYHFEVAVRLEPRDAVSAAALRESRRMSAAAGGGGPAPRR